MAVRGWHDQHCSQGASVAAVGGCQCCFSPSRSPESPNCSSQPTSSSSPLTRAASSSPLLKAPSTSSSCWSQGAANTCTRCARHQVQAGRCWGSLSSESCPPCRSRGLCRAEPAPPSCLGACGSCPLAAPTPCLCHPCGLAHVEEPGHPDQWCLMSDLDVPGGSGARGRPEQPLQLVDVPQRPPRPFTYWQ